VCACGVCLIILSSSPPSNYQTNTAYNHCGAVHTLTMMYVCTHTHMDASWEIGQLSTTYFLSRRLYTLHIILYCTFPQNAFFSDTITPPPSNTTLAKHRHKYYSCTSRPRIRSRGSPLPQTTVVILNTRRRRIRFNSLDTYTAVVRYNWILYCTDGPDIITGKPYAAQSLGPETTAASRLDNAV